ncbi:GAF domain-containing protein [Terracoccus luteus]|jgi:transcriptional regulator with GAF, ATPase, and Fis domain|uniref:GAF domain-containing protein n=1 Tax=Terracoccus luteus TaxID=53356 RepID=A0A495XVY8_9MICO|nr:GAF and ANTAR domain-containing protein [Terracoccus luteus]RKT76633.1 GAF domain-containing protein [Terracoccus luteus]
MDTSASSPPGGRRSPEADTNTPVTSAALGDGPRTGADSARGRDKVVDQLAALARDLEAEDDPALMLEEIVRAAVELIPGVDEASLSIVTGRRRVEARHPSGDLPRRVDAMQNETGQGPCLDAIYSHRVVRVDDMATESRWPEFTPRAVALGAVSMLSFQLFVVADTLGALNLFGREPNAFDEDSEYVGSLFASHAAIAFADAEKVRHLNDGMAARDVIGQAKGILMERFRLTPDQAFTLLIRLSQRSNHKLRDVAHELTVTGTTPGLSEEAPT